jgi:Na+-translocating ferredoxin:NAD+ oxidoreductase RnfG subunit
MRRFGPYVFWPAAAVVAAAAPVHIVVAASYLSVSDAQRALFPAARSFDELVLAPTSRQLAAIAAAAGPQAPHGMLRTWIARDGDAVLGYVFVDNVIGREDYITYAVGVDAKGTVVSVEILDYRESHGGEIRNKRWLDQFAGRGRLEELTFRTDIKNIAGATLSSEHLTAGVRRILALWQVLVKP